MNGQRIGYVRVSTFDQNEARQLDGLSLDKVFLDKASGKNDKRPELEAMLDYAREGDCIVIHSMDRLARNLDDLRAIVQKLTLKGVKVEFIKESLVFNGEDSAIAKLMLSIMGAFAEFERSIIKERQKEGIEIAKRSGKYKGGKKALSDDEILQVQTAVNKGRKKAEVAREYNISRETLYQYLKVGKTSLT